MASDETQGPDIFRSRSAFLGALTKLYGAVTIGDAWRFGIFDVATQQITQDISLYQVPDDTGDVIATLVNLLTEA